MFYVADKFIPYTSKTIEEDVLTKMSRSDEEFTPFEPMKQIMINYIPRQYHSSGAVIDQCVREIKKYKFDPAVKRPTDESPFTRDNEEAKTLTEDEFYYFLDALTSWGPCQPGRARSSQGRLILRDRKQSPLQVSLS